jgi:hypothetical protein
MEAECKECGQSIAKDGTGHTGFCSQFQKIGSLQSIGKPMKGMT